MKNTLVALSLLLLIMLTGCTSFNDIISNITGTSNEKVLNIRVPVPMDYLKETKTDAFLNGINIAKDELSNLNTDTKINISIDDDKGTFSTSVNLAQEYIDSNNTVCVIGHCFSDLCSAMAKIYERDNITMLIPIVSSPILNNENYNYIYQNIVNDKIIGKNMCDYTLNKGSKNVVIYYEDSNYGIEMSNIVDKYCKDIGLSVVGKVGGTIDTSELKTLCNKWELLEYDTVFVISNIESGCNFINNMKSVGSEANFICTDAFDSQETIDNLGDNANDLIVMTTSAQDYNNELYKNFYKSYMDKYGIAPDSMACIGYDSVKIVIDAIVNHKVSSSEDLANYLKNSKSISSIFGDIYFENNIVQNKGVYIKKIEDLSFVYEH